ncbi:MAG: CHAD domain-containing protein [Rhodanobacter sp.]|nr:CHAD domain-containing protein [Rhodanobacter sp.]
MNQINVPAAIVPATTAPGLRLRDYAAAELARAIACLAWRGGRLHTGVHQARKSLRRTRASLALGRPSLGPGARLIDRELRRINAQLSKLRDAHALVETLDLLLRKTGDATALSLLRRARRIAARARAQRARTSLADDPGLQDKRALLLTLQAALPALSWDVVTETGVHRQLQRSQLRASKTAARARETGDDEDWHRWRRRERRFSQQHRALGEGIALPPAAADHHKKLAVLLGEARDYVMLREHCGKRSMFAPADRASLRALIEQGTARIRERVAKTLALVNTGQPDAAQPAPQAPHDPVA